MRRVCVAVSVLACAALRAPLASADPGSITLDTGEVVTGDIQEVVPDEYVIVQLPGGAVKTIPWKQIAQAPPPPASHPELVFGARLGVVVPSGIVATGPNPDSYTDMGTFASSGWAFEGDIGFHVTPRWTLYGFWEYDLFRPGTEAQSSPVSHYVGLGVNVVTSPRRAGAFVFDLAMGARWMRLVGTSTDPRTGNPHTSTIEYSDSVPVRLGCGLIMLSTRRLQIDLMGQLALGGFTKVAGGPSCEGKCPIVDDLQFYGGLTAGARFAL